MQNTNPNRLGIPELTPAQLNQEISERVRCARLWCQHHWHLLCDPDAQCRVKFQLYKSFVRPILTYGCELWSLNRRNSKKLLRFECAILLEIYKSKYPHRHPKRLRPNLTAVYWRFRDTDVVDHVRNERLRWNDLLQIEERALERGRSGARTIHWWDQSSSNSKTKPKKCPKSTRNASALVISCKTSHKYTSSPRSRSMDDSPS